MMINQKVKIIACLRRSLLDFANEMNMFSGLCAISGAKFGPSAKLRTLTGARAESHRYLTLCREIMHPPQDKQIVFLDSVSRNQVYLSFNNWIYAIKNGVAIVLISTHAFQGSEGLVFQFEDSVAEYREYSGVSLRDLYMIVSKSKAHFYFIIECCRTKITMGSEMDDFHPANVTTFYSCCFGEEVLDIGEGVSSMIYEAIIAEAEDRVNFINFSSILVRAERLAQLKGRQLYVVGRPSQVDVNISGNSISHHRRKRLVSSVELRTQQLSADKMMIVEASLLAIKENISYSDSMSRMYFEEIKYANCYRIWCEPNFTSGIYDLIMLCIENIGYISSIEMKFEDSSSLSQAVSALGYLGFMKVSQSRNEFYRTGRLFQQIAHILEKSIMFSVANSEAQPISIEFAKDGLFEFAAQME